MNNDMHLSVCIVPSTFSQTHHERLYQRDSMDLNMMNSYDQMSSIMRANSTKSDSFGGAGTARQLTRSNTDYNYDYTADDDGDEGGCTKYLDNLNINQRNSTFYLHSNGNISDKPNAAIAATGYRSHSPRSSISDSGSSISNSNSNSSANNNNPASFQAEEYTTRSFCASSRSSNSNATLTTNNEWLKLPNKINDNYNNDNDIVNNNDDEDWINSNGNVNVSNRVNYTNCMDSNYANNNQPNRRNSSRTSRRTSSLRVYH